MANQEYQASLKSADTEEHIDIYFYRPIGYQWARFFRMLHVTPNVVTILSIFHGCGSGYLLRFQRFENQYRGHSSARMGEYVRQL